MTVVRIPFEARSEDELIMEVEEETPLTREVSVLTAEVSAFVLMKLAVVVATFPLTIEVRTKEFVEVETVRVLEVEDAIRLVRSVEVATPLMVVVSTAPDVERPFEVMTDEVARRPLMVVESTLPVTPCVKEVMIDAATPVIPLMIVSMMLPDVEATFEVITDVVPTDPPMFEVRTFPTVERVLLVVRLVMVAFVAVSVVRLAVPMSAP
jgi:hypothetical protein